MQDNTNFNIMCGCVRGTRSDISDFVTHHTNIGQSVCIFSLMTAYETSQSMYSIHVHYAFLNKCGARCWWRSWLRHCATSRKVAGSIPDVVIGILH